MLSEESFPRRKDRNKLGAPVWDRQMIASYVHPVACTAQLPWLAKMNDFFWYPSFCYNSYNSKKRIFSGKVKSVAQMRPCVFFSLAYFPATTLWKVSALQFWRTDVAGRTWYVWEDDWEVGYDRWREWEWSTKVVIHVFLLPGKDESPSNRFLKWKIVPSSSHILSSVMNRFLFVCGSSAIGQCSKGEGDSQA